MLDIVIVIVVCNCHCCYCLLFVFFIVIVIVMLLLFVVVMVMIVIVMNNAFSQPSKFQAGSKNGGEKDCTATLVHEVVQGPWIFLSFHVVLVLVVLVVDGVCCARSQNLCF